VSAAPHTPRDAAGVAEVVHDAVRRDAGLRIRGAGTWAEVGMRVDTGETLDLSALRGIREYTAADLTITVGAATTLAELDQATRAHGQWCPLLPWGDDAGTVGATLATATSGPFATSLGRPRDLAIGLECVDGTGRIVRAGGRVVKNVAGFDLVRLMTGQWGTLGIITEVNLRLRARPVTDETVVLAVRGDAAAMRERVAAFARGPYAPLACAPLRGGRWLVRLGGNATFVRAALGALRTLGDCETMPSTEWDVVRRDHAPLPSFTAWRWDALSRRIKERFDPMNILNPGLLDVGAEEGSAA
jgi:glycolate oxidase FAD binding subunit